MDLEQTGSEPQPEDTDPSEQASVENFLDDQSAAEQTPPESAPLGQSEGGKGPFEYFGGRQVEAAALGKALAYAGMTDPLTRQPLSEAMLFGLGGGLGLGYFVYESSNFVSLFLGTRFMTVETPQVGFIQGICERLGVASILQTAASPGPAERKLVQALDQQSVVIVWVDPRNLPYYGTPNAYHCFVVYGFDESKGRFRVSDRSSAPVILTAGEMTTARNGEGAPKYRAITVEVPPVVARPDEVAPDAMRDFCRQMQEGFGPPNFRKNFGLSALQKWAGLLVDKSDKRGWTKFFPPGERLFAAQVSLFEQIENRSQDGMALRPIYADFLDEAAQHLENPRLSDVGVQFRAAGDEWRALADALLPDSVPLFAEAKNQLKKKKTIFEKAGSGAMEEAHTADIRLAEIRGRLKVAYPLQKNEVKDLLQHLHDQVLRIYDIETKAVADLQEAVAPQ